MPNFGDRSYGDTGLTPHYAHHPGAPATFLVGNVLRQSYWFAQNHARVCLTQGWGFNAQDAEADLATTRGMIQTNNTNYGGVTRGWRVIPDETTHLVAVVQYYVITWRPTRVEHRLSVIDSGSSTDTGTATRDMEEDRARHALYLAATGRSAPSSNQHRQLVGEHPLTGGWLIQEDWVEVELSNVSQSAPGTCEIRLEARANQAGNSGTFSHPVDYVTVYAQVWTEMRY